MNKLIIILLFSILLLGAKQQLDLRTIIYLDEKGKVIFNIDRIDYWKYKNKRLTFSGFVNEVGKERLPKVVREVLRGRL